MATLVINTKKSAEILRSVEGILKKEFKLPFTLIDYNKCAVDRLQKALNSDDDILFRYAQEMKGDSVLAEEFLKDIYPVNVKHDTVKIIVGQLSNVEWSRLKAMGAYMVDERWGELDADVSVGINADSLFAYQLLGILTTLVRMEWVYRLPTVRAALRREFKEAVVI